MTPVDPLASFFWREDEEVPELGVEGAAEARPSAPEEPLVEHLAFWLGEELFAIRLAAVRELQRPPPITEVPRAPPWVLGVITLRGDVLPVFDPRVRLGLPLVEQDERLARVVIVDPGRGRCGLLVDRVDGVLRLPASAVTKAPGGLGASADVLTGVGRVGGKLVAFVDLARLFTSAPERA